MTTAAEIAALDATAQAALVRSGQVSATELVDGAIDRIERLNPQLNAVVIPLFERARAAVADAADRALRRACLSCSRTSSWRSRARRCARARCSCATTCPRSPPNWSPDCAGPGW